MTRPAGVLVQIYAGQKRKLACLVAEFHGREAIIELCHAGLKLAEARRKLRDNQAAKEAYTKYLELDSSSKTAQDVRKTLAKLK
jgi:uncharacterized protein involved in type VI secretion and phage assembly